MLCGVLLVSLAGFGRDNALKTSQRGGGNFAVGLAMVIAAGVLSVGLSFSFVYGQDPVIRAMRARGAGDIGANFAVWAISLNAGALVNITPRQKGGKNVPANLVELKLVMRRLS